MKYKYENLFGGESLDIQTDSDLDQWLAALDQIQTWPGTRAQYNNMARSAFLALFLVCKN